MASALRRPLASIVGVILALGWPLLFLLVPSMQQQNLTHVAQDVWVLVSEWAAVAIVALLVIFWERLPLLASTGFRRLARADRVIIGVLAGVAIIFAICCWAGRGSYASPILVSYAAIPFILRFALVFTAGICEEFCFRGYAIERLTALTGRPWIGVLAAIVLFTLGHVGRYGFSSSLIVVAIIGTALSLLYVWRRNIWPCIALHWFIDGTQLLIATAFVAHPH